MLRRTARYGISSTTAASCPDVPLFKPVVDRARRESAIPSIQIEGLGCMRFHFQNRAISYGSIWHTFRESCVLYDVFDVILLQIFTIETRSLDHI
jgi:hypothetical protein